MRVLWSEEDMTNKVEEIPEEDWTIIYPILFVAVCSLGVIALAYMYL